MDKSLPPHHIEDIETLPLKKMEKMIYVIDMDLAYNKTKRAFAH